jgi:hypothetical protein
MALLSEGRLTNTSEHNATPLVHTAMFSGSNESSLLLSLLITQGVRSSCQGEGQYIIFLCIGIITAIDFAYFMISVPLIRVYENIVCHGYYAVHDPTRIGPNHDIEEGLCKVNILPADGHGQ